MLAAPLPPDDAFRLATLTSLGILDTPAEERFDRITRLARHMLDVPIALISLVDAKRQWFKSRCGLTARQTARDISFCGHAILSDRAFVVEDAKEDSRFWDNPLVLGEPRIRFYAGIPLVAPNGARLGTLCVIDTAPRVLGAVQRASLQDLASIVEDELMSSLLINSDALTGLPNRRGFSKLAAGWLRDEGAMSLLYIDLDDFKTINDTHGHAVGDQVLVAFASALCAVSGPRDTAARLSGDEFCVLLGAEDNAEAFLSRLRAATVALEQAGDIPCLLGFSAGVVSYDPCLHNSLSDLFEAADMAMYQDKTARKCLRAP